MSENKLSSVETIKLQILLLGNVEIHVAKNQVHIRYAKLKGLLAILVMSAGKPQQRDYLASLFWPEMTSEDGRKNLRRALYNLKSSLGDASHLISSNNQSITIAKCGLDLDVNNLVSNTTRSSENNNSAYFIQLEQKIKCYRDEFMAGFTLPDNPEFEDWLQIQRESFSRHILNMLEQLSNHYEQVSDYSKALKFALHYTELNPLNEDMRCKVMRLYALNDQKDAALQQYEATHKILVNELGIQPREETRQLATRIRSGKFNKLTNDTVLNEIISDLYRCVDQPDEWLNVTGKIAAMVGTEKFVFASRDRVTLEMKGQFYWTLGDGAMEAYISHYSNLDILSQSLERAPRNRFHTSHDLYPDKQLFSSEFHNDYCKPFGISHSIGVAFDDPDSMLYTQFACLWDAGSKKLQASDIQPLNILVPHLQQFVRLRNKFEHLQNQARSTEQIVENFSMSALICNAKGKILANNALAEDMMRTSNIFTSITKKIVFYQQHHVEQFNILLHHAINAIDGGEDFSDGTWHAHKNNTVLEFSIFPFTFRPEGLLDHSESCALVLISDNSIS